MTKFGEFDIELEKGEAEKPFSDLSNKEREKASVRILKKVVEKAKEFNLTPVIKESSHLSELA